MKPLAEKILDELDAATWATTREDKLRVIEEACEFLYAPGAPKPTRRNTEYDPERLAIAAKVAADAGRP